jgi:hypothetical protein
MIKLKLRAVDAQKVTIRQGDALAYIIGVLEEKLPLKEYKAVKARLEAILKGAK